MAKPSENKATKYPWRGLQGAVGTQEGAPLEGVLIVTARILREAYDAALRELNVNLSEASILGYVDAYETASQTQISNAVGAGRATTGLRLDALESRGLIEKQPDPTDRRIWRIVLTREGRQCAKEIYRIDQQLRKIGEAGISAADLKAFTRCLLRMQRNIADAGIGVTVDSEAEE